MRRIHFEQGQAELFADERSEDELFGTEGQLRAARADDHVSHPPGDILQRISLNRRFSSEEMERIRFGFGPPDMDYKWFMYYDRGALIMHRSWTGYCIYRIDLVENADGSGVATQITVYARPDKHGRKIESPRTIQGEVLHLIESHLIDGVFDGWDDFI